MKRYLSNNIEDYPDGIILPVDKPYRWTSADVVRKVKYAAVRHFGKKNLKVGHAGTLDPLATGILLVCIGPATRRAEALQNSPKEYVAGVCFGATTPSYDLEKDIDSLYPSEKVSEGSIRAILPDFLGEQDQIAPLFSAKSVDGVRAYETARKLFRQGLPLNAEGILTANRISIYDLELLSFKEAAPVRTGDFEQDSQRIKVSSCAAQKVLPRAEIRVACSKGTYIRAFARDLGEALETGAFLGSLRRTKNGGFTLEDAVSLEEALEMLRV